MVSFLVRRSLGKVFPTVSYGLGLLIPIHHHLVLCQYPNSLFV
ncbi:hypothetical protein Goarm_016453 [Gossypium armourianum]|uniref:Uncharacterized protein n=1 Tax=Gossypium armourianum TaxID=34283 RepID=A0A7J9JCL7_9ROSI|nr:hypothetical protein [Gossypium armourianum]